MQNPVALRAPININAIIAAQIRGLSSDSKSV
jgi:hypothetical protein